MTAFMTFHWGWLVGALLLGLAMGWIAVVQHGEGLSKATVQRIALALVVAIGIAVARVVPGRPGYWLDLGLVMFASYLVGCAIGSALRDRVVARQVAAGRVPVSPDQPGPSPEP
ncbi:MAG: hypothetical protein WBA29_18900 [Xanthobacteraceae bacterium]